MQLDRLMRLVHLTTLWKTPTVCTELGGSQCVSAVSVSPQVLEIDRLSDNSIQDSKVSAARSRTPIQDVHGMPSPLKTSPGRMILMLMVKDNKGTLFPGPFYMCYGMSDRKADCC